MTLTSEVSVTLRLRALLGVVGVLCALLAQAVFIGIEVGALHVTIGELRARVSDMKGHDERLARMEARLDWIAEAMRDPRRAAAPGP